MDSFKPDEATLLADHRKRLNRFIANIRGGQITIIIGLTDSKGPEELNDVPGGDRAMTVEDYLRERRAPQDELYCISLGKRMPAVPDQRHGTPKNRRVICLIIEEVGQENGVPMARAGIWNPAGVRAVLESAALGYR